MRETVITCDLCNQRSYGRHVRTLRLDHVVVRLDLCNRHNEQLEKVYQNYMDTGQILTTGEESNDDDLKGLARRVREWAEANGVYVKSSGRIPREVQIAWEEDTGEVFVERRRR